MRQKRPWIRWEQLGIRYKSAMITLWNGHRPVIVCNDAWCISDLFEKRANIYSSRPRMVMMGDLTDTTNNNQVCLKYNDQWRLHRRLTAVKEYRPFQGDETKVLMEDLLRRPDDYVESIERYSCSVASVVAWGRRIDNLNDYVAKQALAFMEVVNAVIPGQSIMEVIPAITQLPVFLNPLPRLIRYLAHRQTRWFFALTTEAKNKADVAKFSAKVYEEYTAGRITWKEAGNLTANLIGGGVDTTSSSMISMILAMCCFPRAQQKAYEEIERVVGPDRLPDWDDELPYVDALVEEVLRWRTVTILGGIPHAPIQDDEYQGYVFPKDTWIVGNVWAIHRNPRDFPDPDEVRPERFLDERMPYPSKKGHNAFGWGRRQCSGQPLAEQGLRLVTARLLWAFKIAPGLDDKGEEVKLDSFRGTLEYLALSKKLLVSRERIWQSMMERRS
ncbi:Cytochrome P450 2E1 [Cercospora beticola]|uniref:Cytochrome P450 2E1 n=2 Tax=Cercospora beticola TaxID=122368 RepID=A0A2G5H997_CERBT|nr:Cytochrome P450 2E1 [Cercospora beticola]PIA89106.1 Cytochrome P450 2E1 [Cercospora beticola]